MEKIRYYKGLTLLKSESNPISDCVYDYESLVRHLKSIGYVSIAYAMRRGYVRRTAKGIKGTPCKLCHYSGRYGIGYTVHIPRYDTTQFHDVEYYVKGGADL